MLFSEHPFLQRFAAARTAGFRAVEFLFPYEYPAAQLGETATLAGVEVVLFNLPPGDWSNGDRGLAAVPGREEEFLKGVERAVVYAKALGTRHVHAMAGVQPRSARAQSVFVRNLKRAAQRLATEGISLLIEVINPTDMPGYYLTSLEDADRTLEAVNEPNLRLQFDVYHVHVQHGDVLTHLAARLERIGHMQLADYPGRGEPGSGEIDFPAVFRRVQRLGYDGWMGCEYRPQRGTVEGLQWLRDSPGA